MVDSSSSGGWSSTEEGISVYFVVFSSLLAFVLVLSKLLHDRPGLASFFPEAGMILMVGMIAGFVVHLIIPNEGDAALGGQEVDDDDAVDVAHTLLSFSPEVFFIALLPPIIFNSGYHLRRDMFFRHITPICLFACVGTAISAVSIALVLLLVAEFQLMGSFEPTFTEMLTFGALISATDPVSTLAVFQSKRVDPHLFYLVFGESVLNDAVGLVLFKAFANFVEKDNPAEKVIFGVLDFLLQFTVDFVGSMCLGIVFGIVVALLLKKIDMRKTTLLELSLYILIMYVPFLLAEMMHLSGIVTILFTGLAARRYIVPNLSAATDANSDVFFRLAAHVSETSIFLELGLSVFGMSIGNMEWRFILWSLLACLVGRAFNVYPITFLFNQSLRRSCTDRPSMEPYLVQVEMTAGLAMDNVPAPSVDGAVKVVDDVLSLQTSPTLTPATSKDMKITMKTANMLWFSGLRGAVAYACVRTFPDTFGHQSQFVVATMVIVLVTVFVLGGTTEMVLNCLKIPMDVCEDEYMEQTNREHLLSNFLRGYETRYIRRCVIRDFDKRRDSKGHQHASGSKLEIGSVSPLQNGACDDDEVSTCYQQHIEYTESQHFENVGYPTDLRIRNSLYDYGH